MIKDKVMLTKWSHGHALKRIDIFSHENIILDLTEDPYLGKFEHI